MDGKAFRYMPREHCEKMVFDGQIRIARSTTYEDGAGLTEGQIDDETVKAVVAHASDVWPGDASPNVKTEITRLKGGGFKLNTLLDQPYWVLCLSADLRRNLFDEFKCDAAVVISNVNEFLCRVAKASVALIKVDKEVHRDGDGLQLSFMYQAVNYIGELVFDGVCSVPISPIFTKPVKYEHQMEYRLAWYPCYRSTSHEYLQVGNMEDIAKVVTKHDVETGRVREYVVEVESFRKAAWGAARAGNDDLRVPPPEVEQLLSASGDDNGSVWHVSLVEDREVDGRIIIRRAIDPRSEEGHDLLRGIDFAEVVASIKNRKKRSED